MSTPILATKLYTPLPRPKVVLRTRLIERLNEGLLNNHKLTLIAAPAGFGKTTLLSTWLATCDRKATWLSLDEADSDPTRFLTYLVAALHKIEPTIGEGVLGALQSPQPPPTEPTLTTLLNEISTIPDIFVLVLDDYHLIDAREADDALTFLIEHMPPQMHLVIATREDPPLPLARLRVRDQLTELRATDLRFTPVEAAGFLKEVMGLDLSAEDVTALEERTEGWIAGLQLAALSMRGHQDVSGFIRAFTGDHRYIVDYLVEEVLQRQSESVRNFLLQTAILDRLNGSLCEAVTGQEQGSARLEALERGNFFIVGLDDKRHWYRYHHLFGEVLYAHLMAEQPGQVATLHRRASEWYEHNGSAAEAVRHALAAGDFERAADLIEMALPVMRRNRQASTLLGWLKAFPGELLQFRPVLSVGYAWGLMDSGELEAVEARLLDAERWLDPTTADMGVNKRPGVPSAEGSSEQSRRMVFKNEVEFRQIPAAIAGYRAARAHVLGDVPGTLKYARQVLDLLPEEDDMWGGAATALLGLAYWTSGNLVAAYQTYGEGRARMLKYGFISDAISGTIMLADIRIEQGHLHEAMSIYEGALQLATQEHPDGTRPVMQGTADLYVGMSELQREYNNLTAATENLLKSKELGERTGFTPDQYRWFVAMARLKQAQGDPDSALELLNRAEQVYIRDFFPNVRPVAALKARVWVGQGRLGEALDWVRKQGLSVEDDLTYLREFEHITLVRILMARFRNRSTGKDRSIDEAVGFLDRLLQAAQEGGRMGSIIEILVLRSLAFHMQGDTAGALMPLERALTLAEPEGYVRLFMNEGPPMVQLLHETAARGLLPAYAGRLLAAFGTEEPTSFSEQPSQSPSASKALVEPLSQRELEVLRLFKTELSGPEIAQKLMIALSTLRTHTKSIYSKLNVDNRRTAIKRAAELDLI